MLNDKSGKPLNMSVMANRLDLINRYNVSLGAPGPGAKRVQHEFINGLMPSEIVATFVAQCEAMIEARRPMVPRKNASHVDANHSRSMFLRLSNQEISR